MYVNTPSRPPMTVGVATTLRWLRSGDTAGESDLFDLCSGHAVSSGHSSRLISRARDGQWDLQGVLILGVTSAYVQPHFAFLERVHW